MVRPQIIQDAPDAAACAASRSNDPTSSVHGRSDGVGAGPPGHAGGVTTRAESVRGRGLGDARRGDGRRARRRLLVPHEGRQVVHGRDAGVAVREDQRAAVQRLARAAARPRGDPTRWKP